MPAGRPAAPPSSSTLRGRIRGLPQEGGLTGGGWVDGDRAPSGGVGGGEGAVWCRRARATRAAWGVVTAADDSIAGAYARHGWGRRVTLQCKRRRGGSHPPARSHVSPLSSIFSCFLWGVPVGLVGPNARSTVNTISLQFIPHCPTPPTPPPCTVLYCTYIQCSTLHSPPICTTIMAASACRRFRGAIP